MENRSREIKRLMMLNHHYYLMYNSDVRLSFDCSKWTLEAAMKRFFNLAGHIPGLNFAEITGRHKKMLYPLEKTQSKYFQDKARQANFAR